ncbi:hypothetical protein COO60DRAFT_380204 [Scenedesmus sp. NREL 46B-D3]|nr:hypothetical protein COO60DRAFT_380204 [Scenedesmus sp. NREL 46B-D3]
MQLSMAWLQMPAGYAMQLSMAWLQMQLVTHAIKHGMAADASWLRHAIKHGMAADASWLRHALARHGCSAYLLMTAVADVDDLLSLKPSSCTSSTDRSLFCALQSVFPATRGNSTNH